MELLDDLRIRVRRWLGLSQFQKSARNRLDILEDQMAVSQADLERLNAATSRIAARVTSLLDQIDQLGTGNDDQVRAQALQEAVLQSSAELRPVMEQLEALGADAANPVPAPSPEQVPVEPGPDVAPVENGDAAADPGAGTVVTDPAPAPGAPAGDTTTTPDAPAGTNPDGDATFDDSGLATDGGVAVEPVDGGAVPTTNTDDASSGAVTPGGAGDGAEGDSTATDGTAAPTGGTIGEDATSSQPGPSGADAQRTDNA